MKVKALKSFSGAVNMSRGQVRDIQDEYVLKDLLKAGYVEALEEADTQASAENDAEPEAEADTTPEGSEGEETLTDTLDAEGLLEMHYNDLKKLAKEMKLDVSGTKNELVDRIARAKAEAGVAE